ncbi:phage tail assembly protein [Nostocaceae cyanobacterium CENA369]|uniref:Phage tail assembly protein n=1 Tax=Dendronalium phyllosphericum CENA369 TaxID=1725256 RepID=A0A8J7LEP7_9NOST|nr:phage tail assembly protein [Dendronalium phyllosphericum]MBH8575152.1 phage tail assembly protein [Dendronalium phyllosphericum CENA369]
MDSKNTINTEFDFILPRGLVDAEGNIHRQGVMRLATAKDEIYLQKNRAALDNSAYGVIVMLSRVIVRLGNLSEITTDLLENLFSRDLAYLREFYNRINQQGDAYIPVQCPQCNGQFQVELALAGEL